MFLYKFCRKYYKFSLPDRKPDSHNRLWTRDETRQAANDVNNRHTSPEPTITIDDTALNLRAVIIENVSKYSTIIKKNYSSLENRTHNYSFIYRY